MTLVPQPVIWPGFGMLIPACFFCCCFVFCLFVLVLFVPGLDYYRKALIILVDGEPANLQTRARPMTRVSLARDDIPLSHSMTYGTTSRYQRVI